MRKMRMISTVIIVLLYTSCFAKNPTLKTFQYEGKSYNYTIQLPKNFDSSKIYPVIIGPSDVKGNDMESFYWKGANDTRGWILINYTIYNATNRLGEIKALLEHLKSNYNVENDKFHTVCFSANSSGIFELVMLMPQYFAGITGMAGNPRTTEKEKLKRLLGIKVQFVVGDQDNYWMNAAKKRHQILLDIGIDSSIEIIKNGKHVMTPLIGKGFLERANRLR